MPDQITQQLRQLLLSLQGWLNVVMAALIGWTLSGLFWAAWPDAANEPVNIESPAASAQDRGEPSTVNLDAILAHNLFGRKAPDEKNNAEILNAPETRLNLTLTGIVSSDRAPQSRALIRTDDGDQQPYAVGDTIRNNVKLHEIYASRVILDRGGRFETLTLEREKAALGEQKQPESEGDLSEAVTSSLKNVREEILANPQRMSDYVRFRPQRENGELKGYRIYPGSDRALFQRVGLRPGELVTAVNGTPLNNPRDAMQVLQNLTEAQSLTVTLERGNEQRSVSVSFE
ncbi:MAG: type II secretion system protein GspC [Salinisphaeraceae bacterium]